MNTPAHPDYLDELERRLAAGLGGLPSGFHARQLAHLVRAQRLDGGFAGRQGGSDVYYTSFALRAAALLDTFDAADLWSRAAACLRQRGAAVNDIVECFCLLNARRLVGRHGHRPWAEADEAAVVRAAEQTLGRHRAPDGGYAKSAELPPACGETKGASSGRHGSLYHTFLAALCWQHLGRAVPHPDEAAAFVRSRQCADGGFAETAGPDAPAHGQGGTNPTAAAVALLAMLATRDEPKGKSIARFLAAMQRPDGGFAAHATAPVSDLMSTFTALVALAELGATSRIERPAVARFVKTLAADGGGFRATPADDAVDVEYAYYGLGTLGLLSLETQHA